MLHVHVVRNPGKFDLLKLRRRLSAAIYLCIVFENGTIVTCPRVGTTRDEVLLALRFMPSPFAFPDRQRLFDRFNSYFGKRLLSHWLQDANRYDADVGHILTRTVERIRVSKIPFDQDIAFLWKAIRRR